MDKREQVFFKFGAVKADSVILERNSRTLFPETCYFDFVIYGQILKNKKSFSAIFSD